MDQVKPGCPGGGVPVADSDYGLASQIAVAINEHSPAVYGYRAFQPAWCGAYPRLDTNPRSDAIFWSNALHHQ